MGRGLAPQIDKVRPDGVMVHDWGRGETPRGVIHPPTKRQRRVSSRLNQVAAGVCETPARAGLDRQTRERARKENDDGHRHNAPDRGRPSGWPTGHGSRAAPIPLWGTGSDRRDRRRDAMGRRTYRGSERSARCHGAGRCNDASPGSRTPCSTGRVARSPRHGRTTCVWRWWWTGPERPSPSARAARTARTCWPRRPRPGPRGARRRTALDAVRHLARTRRPGLLQRLERTRLRVALRRGVACRAGRRRGSGCRGGAIRRRPNGT